MGGLQLCGAAFFDIAAGCLAGVFGQKRGPDFRGQGGLAGAAVSRGTRLNIDRFRAGRRTSDVPRRIWEIRKNGLRESSDNSLGVQNFAVPRFSPSLSAVLVGGPAKNGARNSGGPTAAEVSRAICSLMGRFRADRRICDISGKSREIRNSRIADSGTSRNSGFRQTRICGFRDFGDTS